MLLREKYVPDSIDEFGDKYTYLKNIKNIPHTIIYGKNGCGKSTTFNCISGLLNQTSGKIEVFGTDVSKMRPDEIQSIGVTRTFQHTRLWREMTVIENPTPSSMLPLAKVQFSVAYAMSSAFTSMQVRLELPVALKTVN